MAAWLSQCMGIEGGGDMLGSSMSEWSHIISHVVLVMSQYSNLKLEQDTIFHYYDYQVRMSSPTYVQ